MKAIIIPQGTKLHTIDSTQQEPLDFPFYAAYTDNDIFLYRQEFPPEIRERYGDIPIFDIVTETTRNILIATRPVALAQFAKMLMNDKIIAAHIKINLDIFRQSFDEVEVERALNEREAKVFNLLEEALSPSGSIEAMYDAFVVSMELDNPMYQIPYGQYGINLMGLGYSGILDEGDMHYNSYTAEAPVIILDPTAIQVIEINRIG